MAYYNLKFWLFNMFINLQNFKNTLKILHERSDNPLLDSVQLKRNLQY